MGFQNPSKTIGMNKFKHVTYDKRIFFFFSIYKKHECTNSDLLHRVWFVQLTQFIGLSLFFFFLRFWFFSSVLFLLFCLFFYFY